MRKKTKLFADRYVRERYKELSAKFRVLDNVLNEKGVSSLDKLNDTIISLYDGGAFGDYSEFKEFADRKFTEKEKR